MKKASPLSKCNNPEFSTKNSRKKQILVGGWECGIERLSDEILIVILSCLTLKEAAKTSVLGHRWRYLWCYASGSIYFDHSNNYHGYSNSFGFTVDHILKLHRSPYVDKFIVRCPQMARSPDRITNWVRFAMQKDVKVFELSLQNYKNDDFPDLHKFLSISRAVKHKDINGLSSLTSLTLAYLKTDDQMMQFLLSNCPLLQHLCLRGLSGLRKLNVNTGSSLKSLIISYCWSVNDLAISAPNLVSFEYGGFYDDQIKVENVPLLSDFTLMGQYCDHFFYFPGWSSKFSNQLEKLSVHLPSQVHGTSLINFDSCFTRLQCLKHLELVLDTVDPVSFLHFVLVTKACPFLSTFVVQFDYKLRGSLHLRKHLFPRWSCRRGRAHAQAALKAHSHEYLKVVKLMNMAFYRSEVRFALSLLQIAKSLEKVIIEPSRQNFRNKRIATTLERVKQLKAILPPWAEMILR